MAFTKVPKITTNYSKIEKYPESYLLFQDGSTCVFQNGTPIVIQDIQDNSCSITPKT